MATGFQAYRDPQAFRDAQARRRVWRAINTATKIVIFVSLALVAAMFGAAYGTLIANPDGFAIGVQCLGAAQDLATLAAC